MEAFTGALENGANALESDVWLSADGTPVLVHEGLLRSGLRRRPISAIPELGLPRWLPSLELLYRHTGGDFDLSLDVKDPAAGRPVMELAEKYGVSKRLWLCGSAAQVRSWKPAATGAQLVVSTTLRAGGAQRRVVESRIEEAAEAGADAVNLRAPEWTPARVTRCHDQRLLAFAWDVQQRATLAKMREYGCDAIYSDFISLLAAA